MQSLGEQRACTMAHPVAGEYLIHPGVAVGEQRMIEGGVYVGCGVDERAVKIEQVSGVLAQKAIHASLTLWRALPALLQWLRRNRRYRK